MAQNEDFAAGLVPGEDMLCDEASTLSITWADVGIYATGYSACSRLSMFTTCIPASMAPPEPVLQGNWGDDNGVDAPAII